MKRKADFFGSIYIGPDVTVYAVGGKGGAGIGAGAHAKCRENCVTLANPANVYAKAGKVGTGDENDPTIGAHDIGNGYMPVAIENAQ